MEGSVVAVHAVFYSMDHGEALLEINLDDLNVTGFQSTVLSP